MVYQMLLQLLVLISTLLLGVGLASRANTRHKLIFSPLLGVLGFSWISFAFASLVGFNQNEIIAASLACIALGAWMYSRKQFTLGDDKVALTLLAACLIAFTLLHNSLLYYDSQGALHGFLTDFNFHASIASTIANGNFPPQYPFFLSGVPLSYYYFPHFYAAHYLADGASIPTAFLLFSTAIAFICMLTYLLSRSFSLSKNASLLSPFLFLSISSLAFLQYFSSSFSAGATLLEILSKPEVSVNALTYQHGFAFVGVLAQFLLSQAAMPVGLAFCLAALLLVVENKFSKHSLVQAGVLLVLAVPFHAFLALAFAAVIALHAVFFEKRENLWQFAPLAFSAGLLYLSFFSQKIGAAGNGVKFIFGWIAQDKSIAGVLAFWLQNLVFLLIPLVAWKHLPKKLQQLILCCVPLFALVNFVSFTPNPWDSGKLLLPAFLLLSIAAAHFTDWLASNGSARKAVAVAFVLLACFFTALVVETLVQHGSETVFDSQEIAACNQVKQLTYASSLFIVSNGYTCISSIAGRRVFVAEPTQLDANALNSTLAVSENEAMLQGSCSRIRKWGVTHFYDGGTQGLSQNADYNFFEQHGSKVWTDGKRSLYQISC